MSSGLMIKNNSMNFQLHMLAMKTFFSITVTCHFNIRPASKKFSTHRVFVRNHVENHCGSKIRAERFFLAMYTK